MGDSSSLFSDFGVEDSGGREASTSPSIVGDDLRSEEKLVTKGCFESR